MTGVFMFGLVEYTIHRFLFHVDELIPDHPMCLFFHFMVHGVHHYLPMDRMRLVMPPVLSLAIGIPILLLTVKLLSIPLAFGFLSGLVVGYMIYDLMHYFLHHAVGANLLPPHFQAMKTYHLAHHYQDPTVGFGITSKLWDRLFGTELVINPKLV
ncbi:fatty acid alpha-hydroxylase [Entomophthora muscae]|uniref:Fatty acid alpha-hydroxylase n=2 Tax=Entomophthora muscae TaxID=34485 RepID=A0ACC2SWP1_9FUNG|nr:fatty acid alpha-hydroxylase [Entomophthora muscae]KAJ9066771.1 fatty acid alpha-hydroxylase [Entomophthora muscae]